MAETSLLADYAEAAAALTAEDGPFPVREACVGGRRLKVFAKAPRNAPAMFDPFIERFAERVLAIAEGRRWSYAEAFAAARRLAGVLQDRFGVRPGDRVGLCMRNRPEWLIAYLAATRIGAIAVLFNSRGTADELGYAAAHTACTAHVADDRRAALLRQTDASTPIILVEDDPAPAVRPARVTPFAEAIAAGLREAPVHDSDPEDPAAILFTSGTTGRAKGAVLTHRNLVTLTVGVLLSGAMNGRVAAKRSGGAALPSADAPPHVALGIFPLFHISGFMTMVAAFLSGGTVVTMRRWDPKIALDLIEAHRINTITGPPLVIADLLEQPDAVRRLSGVTRMTAGGQATPQHLIARIARDMPQAGQGVGWGSTETSGAVTVSGGPLLLAYPKSCGRVAPVSELRVVDEAGRDLAAGEVGELWVRSPMVMRDYWNAPEATAAVFEGDWFKTGDLGYVDEGGLVYVVDRLKDMVISAGENIYCAEVERVLSSDPALVEAAMFGVPDARLGERAVAAVTVAEGRQRSEAEIKAFVGAALADYKVPAEVVFDLGPLPRNATGKVDKAKLRARYLERIAQTA
jgi:acyl-CoA synthetase (AMP-forming)/AMP-acid ligase II